MIAIGCDHGGFPLKKEIIKFLDEAGYEYEDPTARRAAIIPSTLRRLRMRLPTDSVKREY